MACGGDSYGTLHAVKIVKLWGLCADSFVYEGCGRLLSDGRPCALGKYKRKLRKKNAESPMGPHSHGRVDHICCEDGEGVYMYYFSVQVGDFVMQVNESSGQQLMGRSGQAYEESCDKDEEEKSHLCDAVTSSRWTIAYVRDQSRECLYQALNFEKASSEVVDAEPTQVDDAESSQVVDGGSNEVKCDDGTPWFGKLKGRILDFSGGIADLLKSFSISD
ncbi:unnamed protein product [Calypogeia fissa]